MGILEAILVAVSLCADCFAVTLCSSVTLKSLRWTNVAKVAISFAVIQAGLLLAGWAFGGIFAARVSTLARGLGFGDDLEYADSLTLGRSIVNRQEFRPQ